MSEDILHRLRSTNQNPAIQFPPKVYNEELVSIEDICLAIANKALVQLGMPAPNRSANDLFDRDLQRETHFDADELGTFVQTNLPKLVPEQCIAYDRIMHASTSQSGGLYFLDAPGGTGKTSPFSYFGNQTFTKQNCTGNSIVWNCSNSFGWWPNSAFSNEITV